MTPAELEDFVKSITAAQSMLTAAILRAIMQNGGVTEAQIQDALNRTEQAALQRRTPETPALTGLIDLLRRDLGLSEGTHPDA